MHEAAPAESVAVQSVVPPFENVTVPVAVAGATVAVSVAPVPASTGATGPACVVLVAAMMVNGFESELP